MRGVLLECWTVGYCWIQQSIITVGLLGHYMPPQQSNSNVWTSPPTVHNGRRDSFDGSTETR